MRSYYLAYMLFVDACSKTTDKSLTFLCVGLPENIPCKLAGNTANYIRGLTLL